MAKQTLPTNFVDDILASSMGGKRKFTITDNGDGTYEIEDVTDYTQTGSDFGSGQINATNQAVNESCDKANVIETMDDIMANQASGMIAGAKAVAELIGKSVKFSDWIAASSPFTAPADGFLRVNYSPDSASRVGTGVITENVAGTVSSSGISNGSNVMVTIPVIQGRTYTISGYPSANIDITAAFMPLRL